MIYQPTELSSEAGHRKAAEELRDKLGWACGVTPASPMVRVEGDEIFTLSLDEFIRANDFGDEEFVIRKTISNGQTYTGGGGSAPIFTVTKA